MCGLIMTIIIASMCLLHCKLLLLIFVCAMFHMNAPANFGKGAGGCVNIPCCDWSVLAGNIQYSLRKSPYTIVLRSVVGETRHLEGILNHSHVLSRDES